MFKLNKKGLMLASATTLLFACSATQTADPIVNQADVSQLKPVKAYQSITSNTESEQLTLEQIMADPDWIGRQPSSEYWADDSQAVYYQQKHHHAIVFDEENDLFLYLLQKTHLTHSAFF